MRSAKQGNNLKSVCLKTTDRCARWKNRNLPNFVTTKTLRNYFRKYKNQFVLIDIFRINNFFNVLPLTGLKTAEKCPSSPPLVIWKGTKYHDYFDHPFLGILTLLEFQKIPIWIFFFFYPLNQFIATLSFAYFKQRKSLPGTWLSI